MTPAEFEALKPGDIIKWAGINIEIYVVTESCKSRDRTYFKIRNIFSDCDRQGCEATAHKAAYWDLYDQTKV